MTMFRLIRTDRNADPAALAGESLLFGRAQTCDVQLSHPSVAAAHAGIKWHADAFWLSALGGAPVLLQGESVQHAPLSDGAIIRLGAYLLRLAVHGEALQITVEFALGLALTELEATEPPSLMGTAADKAALESYWAEHLPAATPTLAQPEARAPRRGPLRLLGLGVVSVALCAALAVWVFPRVYAPGPLSAAHTRRTLTASLANKPVASCASCHTLTGTMQGQCAACHTTPDFQAEIAQKHLKQGLTCRACHSEHRGDVGAMGTPTTPIGPISPIAPITPIRPNQVCVNCHHDALHGPPVSYPVKNGLWSWDGLSQTAWQTRGLPGRTADYNLREQFHLLHTQGPAQGRAQCADCHLGGMSGAALKQSARASCAQCHALQAGLAAELARLAGTQALQPGATRCVSCHTQHGAEKDLRASVRK